MAVRYTRSPLLVLSGYEVAVNVPARSMPLRLHPQEDLPLV